MYDALLLVCLESERELLEAELYGLGTLGITERDLPGGFCELEAFFAERFAVPPGFAGYRAEWRQCSEPVGADAAAWVDTFEPFAVGQRLYLTPAWRDNDPVPPGRVRLAVHARQASGSGYQPATRLALTALERHLRPGDRFLDVGTGSGILSAAAALLAAGQRFACEIDLAALAEARENETPAALWAGSPRSLAAGTVDLVAANLNAVALVGLAPEFLRVLVPGGRLIVAGFTARNTARVTAALAECPLEGVLACGDWRALVFHTPH